VNVGARAGFGRPRTPGSRRVIGRSALAAGCGLAALLGVAVPASAASAVSTPRGCTANIYDHEDASFVEAKCGVSAPGLYFRVVGVCQRPNGSTFTVYGPWEWQGATAYSDKWCPGGSGAIQAGAETGS
jgi:hypothetical protein